MGCKDSQSRLGLISKGNTMTAIIIPIPTRSTDCDQSIDWTSVVKVLLITLGVIAVYLIVVGIVLTMLGYQ